MRDGTTPNLLFAVEEFLNSVFPEPWTGHGGPIAWPVCYPDINQLDFLSPGTSQFYRLCYISRWYPGLATP
jgi:hypothetical protein